MNKKTINYQLISGVIGILLGTISFVIGASTTMDNPIKHVCLYTMMFGEILIIFALLSTIKNLK